MEVEQLPLFVVGGGGFSERGIEVLLDHVGEIHPISGGDWEEVATAHNELFGDRARTAESLKCKFNDIARKTGPTGNPNCPAYVRTAKDIREVIIRKTDGSSGGSEASDSEESSDNDNDDARGADGGGEEEEEANGGGGLFDSAAEDEPDAELESVPLPPAGAAPALPPQVVQDSEEGGRGCWV